MTEGADLTTYRHHVVDVDDPTANAGIIAGLHAQLEDAGFRVVDLDTAIRRANTLHNAFAPQLEYLIDYYLCPRGFWSSQVALQLD